MKNNNNNNGNNWNPEKDEVFDPEIHGQGIKRQRSITQPEQDGTTLPPQIQNPRGLSRQNSRASDASLTYRTPSGKETPFDDEYQEVQEGPHPRKKSKIELLGEEYQAIGDVINDLKTVGLDKAKYFETKLGNIEYEIGSQEKKTANKRERRNKKKAQR